MSEQGDKNLITDVSVGEGVTKESEGIQQGAGVLKGFCPSKVKMLVNKEKKQKDDIVLRLVQK